MEPPSVCHVDRAEAPSLGDHSFISPRRRECKLCRPRHEVHECFRTTAAYPHRCSTPCTPAVVIIASSKLVFWPCYTQLGTACSTRLGRQSGWWPLRYGSTTTTAEVKFLSYGCAANLVLEVLLHRIVAFGILVVPSVEHSDFEYLDHRPTLF